MVLLNACCQQKKCYGVNDLNEIQLNHFTSGEADSIVVKRYQKNSDFSTLVDSFNAVMEDSQTNDSSLVVYMGSKLNINYDYKIIFPSIEKTYLLTDFSVTERECNACFPLRHDHYNELDSYLVNGVKQKLSNLQITKSH
jgi:hypothetical protein